SRDWSSDVCSSDLNVREHAIDPIDDDGSGAKVLFQAQRLKSQVAQSVLLQLDEESDLRLPEPIDRLHRIAHAKERSPVAIDPSGRQPFEKVELRERRVLKLVDQNVLDAMVECER